jgi:hypothetical protein
MHSIGVVGGQALKCSASEALNAESYNTLPNWFTFLNLFFIPNRRVLYPYNTFLIQTHQTIFDFYRMHIIGVVVGQALKCSASEALNAESYNTLPDWFTLLNLFFIPNRRVLYPYNTNDLNTIQLFLTRNPLTLSYKVLCIFYRYIW